MTKKICSKCKIEKDVCEFGVRKNGRSGYLSLCVLCDKMYKKEYYEKNVNKIKENRKKRYRDNICEVKKYNEKNKERIKIKSKEYYKNNSEKIKEQNKKNYYTNREKNKERRKEYYKNNYENIIRKKKEYYKNNLEKIKNEIKEYKKKNTEFFKEYYNNKRNTDPLFKLSCNIRARLRVFLKSKNMKKHNKTFDIVGCTPEFLKEHIENQFTEGMSWELFGGSIHIDHIIPLSSAKTEEEIYKLCHYSNLQPLWAEDNLKKSNKII